MSGLLTIIHFELLPLNATINVQIYCQQLERLNPALRKEKTCSSEMKRAMFHQDNARPQTARIMSQKIEELCYISIEKQFLKRI